MLGVGDLEAVATGSFRGCEARSELSPASDVEEHNRELIEGMVREPERHRWVRVSNEDIGEHGVAATGTPAHGGALLGMILGWWRVKLSLGCPLARGAEAPGAEPALR